MQGGIIILNRISYENAQNYGIGVLELIDERQSGKSPADSPIIFAPLKRTELTGEIVGPLATICLTQSYSFTKEQCAKVIEARYRFPMPGDAAVTSVKVCFGDIELITELKDRNLAKQEYKEAKREGKQAIMVTRESPDVFTICIAGLEPGQDVKVDTRYVQMAKAEDNGWSIRIPLTTAPRYVRKDETSSRYAQGQPLAVLRDPGHRFSMDLKLRCASSIESPTHRVNIALEGEDMRIQLQEGEVIPDRDCILRWKPRQEADRPALHVLLHEDDKATETYFLAMVSPPSSGELKKARGEYVLLVDHSSSMEGAKWAAADWAVEKFLRGLDQNDYFTIGLFHNTTKWFARSLMKANETNVESAIDFLQSNRDSEGTELGVALEQALQVNRMDQEVSRHLLIITDAEVSDGGRILRLAGEDSRRPDRRRISMLCIDAAPNSFLALELAERGGGIARFLTSDPKEGDITTALGSIMEFWSRTIYTNLRLFSSRHVVAADREVSDIGNGYCYVNLGDMAAGQPVWVSGKFPDHSNGEAILDPKELSFCLMTKDGKKLEPMTPDITKWIEGGSGIKPFFGARKLLGLEFLIHSRYGGKELLEELTRMGYDPEVVLHKNKLPSLYPENSRVNETEALRNFIVEESLKYGLPSSETAFIAVYQKSGKRIEATALVPNALPDGWSEQFENKCYSYGGSGGSSSLRSPASPGSKRRAFRQNAACGIIEDIDGHSGISSARATKRSVFIVPVDKDTIGHESMIFNAIPQFVGNEAVLLDRADGAHIFSARNKELIYLIRVGFPEGSPWVDTVDAGIEIMVYIEDMVVPKATVKLADIMRQANVRPLNLEVDVHQPVKVVLKDTSGVWAKGVPKMTVSLGLRRIG